MKLFLLIVFLFFLILLFYLIKLKVSEAICDFFVLEFFIVVKLIYKIMYYIENIKMEIKKYFSLLDNIFNT